jgi:hypothetical protein
MFLATRSPMALAPVVVRKDAAGQALYASRDYQPGEVVFGFEDLEWRARRDQHTVEHPDGRHFFHPVLANTAHACEPNSRIDFEELAMVAVRPIAAGEAVTFDYETTERWFTHPFWCLCGSRRCRGRIG